MSCSQCNQPCKRNDWTRECVSCEKMFHEKCIEHAKKIYDLPNKNEVYNNVVGPLSDRWWCDDCNKNASFSIVGIAVKVSFILKKLEEMERKHEESEGLSAHFERSQIENMKTLKSDNDKILAELNVLKNKVNSNVNKKTDVSFPNGSFADVVNKNKNMISGQSLTIKPKIAEKTVSETRQALGTLDSKKFGVIGAERASINGWKIVCNKKENRDELAKAALEKLGNDFEIVKGKEKFHRIKIFNVMIDKNKYLRDEALKKFDLDLLNKELRKENDVLKNDNNAKVILAYEKPKRSNNIEMCIDIVMQVSASSHDFYAMKKNMVGFEWSFYTVDDGIFITRCLTCLGFGHKKENCNKKTISCSQCGGNHLKKDCKANDLKCINCVILNQKLKNDMYDTNHSAMSRNCSALKIRKNTILRSLN